MAPLSRRGRNVESDLKSDKHLAREIRYSETASLLVVSFWKPV